ncbi:hypothetical protein [Desulfonema magnum]|uniref:Uncharacterized protein n=1 Tax=Desulfonema magnum TaxID=45655 RepID=A0A975BMP8_9BACT|nr:hypothetical protein [Desulfonema magnum]QTA88372.1 Uncharacterized protein dnm_044160 [Desulfonema magnum]
MNLRVFEAKKSATKARRHKETQRDFVNLRTFVSSWQKISHKETS